jgi:hypothetical protein
MGIPPGAFLEAQAGVFKPLLDSDSRIQVAVSVSEAKLPLCTYAYFSLFGS